MDQILSADQIRARLEAITTSPKGAVQRVMLEHADLIKAKRREGATWAQIAAALGTNPLTTERVGFALFGSKRKPSATRSPRRAPRALSNPPSAAAVGNAGDAGNNASAVPIRPPQPVADSVPPPPPAGPARILTSSEALTSGHSAGSIRSRELVRSSGNAQGPRVPKSAGDY